MTIQESIDTHYKTLDHKTTVQKALSVLNTSKDVAIVTKDGTYQGIITAEALLRGDVNAKEATIKKAIKHAPKIEYDASSERVVKMMYENDLKILPVFMNGNIHGVIRIGAVLSELVTPTTDLRAEELMTENPVTITPDTKLNQAISKLRDINVSRLPVVEKNQPVGILTVYDITHTVMKPKERHERGDPQTKGHFMGERKTMLDATIRSIMNPAVETVTPVTNIYEVIQTMREKSIGSMLVADGELIGIITRKDILRRIVQEINQDKPDLVHIQISSRTDINRQRAIEMISKFVKKYKSMVGPGHISLHIKKQKETLKGERLLFGRLHVRTQNLTENISGEGYGQGYLLHDLLRKLKTRIFTQRQDNQQLSTAEYLEHFDITSL